MRNVVSKLSAVLVAILFFSASLIAQDETGQDETVKDPIEQGTQTEQQDPATTGQDQTGQQDESTMQQDQTKQFETSAQQLTDNLATTITLTDEQKTKVTEAISEYYGKVIGTGAETGAMQGEDATVATPEESEQWLNDEISEILDESQKAQWETAKADFWNQVRDNVATMQQGNRQY